MRQVVIRALIQANAATIQSHIDELTSLDQAIGDGDHGFNMKRGFEAMESCMDRIQMLPASEALIEAGKTLVMSIGGASGPLYGSMLMAMGSACDQETLDQALLSKMINAGVNAIKARGKSDVGDKTMLDVLAPVSEVIQQKGTLEEIRKTALAAMENTKAMKANKGRAAFLGERSIGHIDPGACSSALMILATCDVMEKNDG